MLKRRLLQIVTAGALATGALLAGPAGQALAAEGPDFVTVRITGTITTEDDDGLNSRPTATRSISHIVTLLKSSPTEVVKLDGACAGNEVRAELRIGLTYRPAINLVSVEGDNRLGHGLKMFEGTDCFSTDLDGTGGFATVQMPASSFIDPLLTAQTGEAFSIDSARARLHVERVS